MIHEDGPWTVPPGSDFARYLEHDWPRHVEQTRAARAASEAARPPRPDLPSDGRCADCGAPSVNRTRLCADHYRAALDRARDEVVGRKRKASAPTVVKDTRPAVERIAEAIGRAVQDADAVPLSRAAVAEAVGVHVASRNFTQSVALAESRGLVRFQRRGRQGERGFWPAS